MFILVVLNFNLQFLLSVSHLENIPNILSGVQVSLGPLLVKLPKVLKLIFLDIPLKAAVIPVACDTFPVNFPLLCFDASLCKSQPAFAALNFLGVNDQGQNSPTELVFIMFE